mgnify:CR=1 FL=1
MATLTKRRRNFEKGKICFNPILLFNIFSQASEKIRYYCGCYAALAQKFRKEWSYR